jgi:pantetheine-phosphate adenylyltransferase
MKIIEKAERLVVLGVDPVVLDRYREAHRFYHTLEYLDDIWQQLESQGYGDNNVLLLATIFHDIIYDPGSGTNEEDSARYFNEVFAGDAALKALVTDIILDTKHHNPGSALSEVFSAADLNILNQSFDKLLLYEQQIFKEFQFVDHKIYLEKRVEVLKSLQQGIDNPALDYLIGYVENFKPRIAVYPGSLIRSIKDIITYCRKLSAFLIR